MLQLDLPKTLEWVGSDDQGFLRLIDQTLLPHQVEYLDCKDSETVCDAIARLAVRGAPAIGCAGAYAVALWALRDWAGDDAHAFFAALEARAVEIANVRPTAVNLSWAVNECMQVARQAKADGAGVDQLRATLLEKAHEITADDIRRCEAIGKNGAAAFADLAKKLGRPLRVETHCNAGSLATAYFGTALSVIYHAHAAGDIEMVWADETRPVDQGARLTAWELMQAGVDCTLICDNMAGSLMAAGKVDAVVVGADRVCANGDFANKIGTYPLAVMAQHHGVPFFVAAPLSTFDFALASGDQIVIEERNPQEVRCAPVAKGVWQPIAPDGVKVFNPAFDVSPAALATGGIITEEGIRNY